MGKLVGGGNAILLLLTCMAVVGAIIIAWIAHRRKHSTVVRTFLGGAAILTLAYGSGVIAASATSREHVLAQGEIKWFCGFYIDCHLGVSIDRAETTPSPTGNLHILTLRMHNSAKNPNIDMVLYRPKARIVDALGNEYTRSARAEVAIAKENRPGPLGSETKVGHEPVEATIVFDLPSNVQVPRLVFDEGWILDRVIELGLINDENSILHKRTLMSLDETSRTASTLEQ